MTALGSYYHVPHISFVVAYILLELLPTPGGKSKKRDTDKDKTVDKKSE